MSDNAPNKKLKECQTCNCPFCGSETEIISDKEYIYSYPLKLRTYGVFHGIFLWNNQLPEDVDQMEVTCTNAMCKRKFYIQCWPHSPFQRDSKTKTPIELSNDKLFLEELLDRAHAGIKKAIRIVFGITINHKSLMGMVSLNTLLVGTMFFVFIIIPAILTGSLGKLENDRLLFVTPILFILLLTSFQRQIGIIRDSLLKFNTLPVLLNEKYPKWPDYSKFNDVAIRRFFFGHPYKNKLKTVIEPPYLDIEKWTQLSSPPLVFGIIAITIGVFFYHYFIPTGGFTLLNYYFPLGGFTPVEVITPDSNPIIYTSFLFNIGYLLFHAPFWFILGNVVWLSLVTPYFIYTISRNLPLRIDPLKDIGGPNVLGEILLKSNVSIALLALGFIAYVIRNDSILKFDPTFEIFNIFLLGIFSFVIFFSFLLPLYPIHKKMRQSKENEINILIEKIDYDKIKNGTTTPTEVNLDLLRIGLINKISSKKEWPFNFNTFGKIIFMTLIPLFELYMSVRSFF